MFRYGEMFKKRAQMVSCPSLGRMTPFKIFANTYFVGTYQASCHLIDTGEGLIMIDPGYEKTAYLVLDSLYKLGFMPGDIKYIVVTHWHSDHAEAVNTFVRKSGAKTILCRDDVEKAAKYFVPDITVGDGDILKLGRIEITFLHTPGHTKGTISPFYYDTDGERTLRVGMFGGAGTNTLMKGEYDFEGCREAYYRSLERLKKEKVDVFIGNHTWNNDTYGKYLEICKGNTDAFIDGELWSKFLDECKKRLDRVIQSES